LGVVKLAVLSNNVFFDGRQVRWRKERWAERRKALQQAGWLSRVKKEAGRERRWMMSPNSLGGGCHFSYLDNLRNRLSPICLQAGRQFDPCLARIFVGMMKEGNKPCWGSLLSDRC
ncbi:MAG: putative transposase, partial [Eubacteriales bacterium]|nr:putative transposase [Eubacteriales bacterium]